MAGGSVIFVDPRTLAMAAKNIKALEKAMSGRGKRKQWNAMITPAAKVIEDGMESNVPISTGPNPHYRYTNSRGFKTRKAGRFRVAYHRGNLKRSIRIHKGFRRTKSLFVGPRVMGRKAAGIKTHSTKQRADGWYARLVDQGTRNFSGRYYVRTTVYTHGKKAIERLKRGMTKYVSDAIRSITRR